MAKEYLNAFMNNSATIRDVLAADITGALTSRQLG